MKHESKAFALFGRNKYERAGAVATVGVLLVLAIALALNALVGCLPYSIAKPTITGLDTFELSGTTIDWLDTLDEDITLYLICEGGKNSADKDIYGFLLRYAEASERIRVEVVDPQKSPDFLTSYGLTEQPESMSLIVSGKTRYKLIPATNLFYYYNSEMGMQLTAEEYQYAIETFSQAEYADYLEMFVSTTTAYFDGESRITNALNYVTREDVPIVYALTGSGAIEPESALKTFLSDTCYDMRTTLSLATLPADCDLLMILAPTADLSAEDAAALASYLSGGGKLLLSTLYNTTDMPNLTSVLQSYGMGMTDAVHVVMEGHTNYAMSDSSGPNPLFYKAHIDREHPALQNYENDFLLYYSHAIELTQTEGVSQTKLLYTSAAAYQKVYNAADKKWVDSEEKAVYTVGAIAEKGSSKILWIASPHSLTANVNATSSQNGNFKFVLSVMNYMSGIETDSIAVESAMLDTSWLSTTITDVLIWGVLIVLILPITLIIVGIVKWCLRKAR